MASDANTKRLDCGETVDFISNLPSNIIDLILKRLPVQDAARMSALSKTWKDIWVNCLCLILDEAAKKIIDLKKLADSMPRICILQLDGYFLKILEPGAAIMERLMPTMEALKCLSLDNVGFYDLVQIQNVICLIRISPNLQKLIIELEPKIKSENVTNLPDSRELMVASVVQYLQSPNLIDLNFNQLKTVRIEGAVDSTALQFIKFLLASSPSLRKMKFSHYVINDPEEALRILAELVRFPRASTTAEIIWKN